MLLCAYTLENKTKTMPSMWAVKAEAIYVCFCCCPSLKCLCLKFELLEYLCDNIDAHVPCAFEYIEKRKVCSLPVAVGGPKS